MSTVNKTIFSGWVKPGRERGWVFGKKATEKNIKRGPPTFGKFKKCCPGRAQRKKREGCAPRKGTGGQFADVTKKKNAGAKRS